MASIMLSAASRPTLAKNARMGHPRSDMGKKEKTVGKGGPPAIGRRTGVTDTAGSPGSATWTYDLMGRIASETRVTANVTKTTSYTYNKDGSVSSITYPSTRVVNYTYSRAGRVVSAIDPTGPINYITSATYAPTGEVATAI